MNRTFVKIVITIFLAFFMQNSVFAINSEFKNTLLNIDLAKISENGYNINLYTSKKYNSPIKVIKKSDLSYYILLPETKNITPKLTLSSPDIRSVSTVLYPYAGVDVNNGYTKISINTTKPLIFNVVTKNATQKATNGNNILTNADIEAKAQKKNSELQQKDIIKQSNKTDKEVKKEEAITKNQVNEVKKELSSSTPSKKNSNLGNPLKKEAQFKKESELQPSKTVKQTPKQTIKKEIKIDSLTKQSVSKEMEKITGKARKETVNLKNKLAKLTTEQKNNKFSKNSQTPENIMAAAKITAKEDTYDNSNIEENRQEVSEETQTDELVTDEEEIITNETEDLLNEGAKENLTSEQPKPENKTPFQDILKKIKNKSKIILLAMKSSFNNIGSDILNLLEEYAITILTIVAGVLSFIVTLFLLLIVIPKFMPKDEPPAKLKNRADLLKKESVFVPKEENETNKENANDKYFVFENNVKQQISLSNPSEAENGKNFELISYDPDIRFNSDNENEKDDLDIIQKILNSDDFVDIEETQPDTPKENIEEFEPNLNENNTSLKQEEKIKTIEEAEKEPIRKNENATAPIGLEHVQKEDIKEEEIQEIINDNPNIPKLLSSYNIDSNTGFMFISYNNNINLMGFIGDNVFNLHNYKTSKLNSYNLQYRLVDKDEYNNIYIVKTETTKLLVKVSRTSINTEIIL